MRLAHREGAPTDGWVGIHTHTHTPHTHTTHTQLWDSQRMARLEMGILSSVCDICDLSKSLRPSCCWEMTSDNTGKILKHCYLTHSFDL